MKEVQTKYKQKMINVIVKIEEGSEIVFEFEQEPTEEQLIEAMDTIGGRKKRRQ